MSYQSYTIVTGANTKTIMDDLRDRIDAHPAWAFVEEVAGTGTRVTQVFRCLGSANSFGTDFYIGVCRTSLTSGIGFIMGETYDGSAKTFGRGAVYSVGGIDVAANGSYATPRHVANETTMVNATGGYLITAGAGYLTGAMGAYVENYYLSITNDRIVLAPSHMGEGVYVGLYESFHTTAVDPFPLVMHAGNGGGWPTSGFPGTFIVYGNQSPNGVFTRDLKLAGLTGQSGAWTAVIQPTLNLHPLPGYYTGKERITNKYWMSRIMVVEGANIYALRGQLRDVLCCEIDQPVTPGDTLTIDGVTHTLMTQFIQYYPYAASTSPTWVNWYTFVSQNV